MADPLDTTALIEAQVVLPASATGDSGSATSRSVADLILADQHLAGKRRTGFGFKMGKIVSGGAR